MDITELKEYERIISISPTQRIHAKQIAIGDSPVMHLSSNSLAPPEMLKNVYKSSFESNDSTPDSSEAIVLEIINDIFDYAFPIKKTLTTVIFDADKSINTSEFNKNERASIRSNSSRLTTCIRSNPNAHPKASESEGLLLEPRKDDPQRIEVKVYIFNTAENYAVALLSENTVEELIKHLLYLYNKSHSTALNSEECELRLVDDEEDEPYHPDYDMAAFQRKAQIGSLKATELAFCKIKKKKKLSSLQSSDSVGSRGDKNSKTMKFRIYAMMLNISEIIEVNTECRLIDLVRKFIKQVNNESLNKIEIADEGRKSAKAGKQTKKTIESMLTLSLHIEGRQSKSILKYEDYATILDFNTYVRHVKHNELDLAYKMYGDAHYSLDGNFTTLSPIFVNKKAELPRESTISESREDASINEEELNNINRMSILSHYRVWETLNSGVKRERILGIDRYGIYLYFQEWKFYSDKHKMESEGKLVIALSSLLNVESCKMNMSKFYVYYIDKKEMKENRLFLEVTSHKIAKEILVKMRLLIASLHKI